MEEEWVTTLPRPSVVLATLSPFYTKAAAEMKGKQ